MDLEKERNSEWSYKKAQYAARIELYNHFIQKQENLEMQHHHHQQQFFAAPQQQQYSTTMTTPTILMQRAVEFAQLKLFDKVIEDTTSAIFMSDNQCDCLAAYCLRSWAYTELGDFQRAIEDCTLEISLTNTQQVEPLARRAALYNRIGEYVKSVRDCTMAITLKVDCTAAYNNRAFAYNQLGELDKAVEDTTTVMLTMKINHE